MWSHEPRKDIDVFFTAGTVRRRSADVTSGEDLTSIKVDNGSERDSLKRVTAKVLTPELQGPQVAVRVAREGSLLILPQWDGEPDPDRVVLEELMRACLVFDPAGRPTFEQLDDSLKPIL